MFLRLLFLIAINLIISQGNANAMAIEKVNGPGGIEAWLVKDQG